MWNNLNLIIGLAIMSYSHGSRLLKWTQLLKCSFGERMVYKWIQDFMN